MTSTKTAAKRQPTAAEKRALKADVEMMERAEAKPSRAAAPLTKRQLAQASKLRAEGATWNAIREVFGVKLGSSAWFRAWERDGIEHVPAGQRPAKTTAKEAS